MEKAGFLTLALVFIAAASAEAVCPIADAGTSRYASEPYAPPYSGIELDGTVVLDGTGSYDPDGYGELTYQWQQVSGPEVVITDADTATPTISGFNQTSSIQECEFALVVSDGELTSEPDIAKVVIVPAFGSCVMKLENAPFGANKPTMIYFNGWWLGYFPFDWREEANLISADSLASPYERYGDMLIVYLSSVAPNYNKAIQTFGYSLGGRPATQAATRINTAYTDKRYIVNRVTLHDSVASSSDVTAFLNSRVDGEQCWVDNYIGIVSAYHPGALNVRFPWGNPYFHGTPSYWYSASLDPATYTTPDIYNNGLVAGAYLSVIGEGKNLQLASLSTVPYYFKWVGPLDEYGDISGAGILEFYNESLYPGRLPEPVTLVGPNDGDFVDANGAVLSCEVSQNVVGYQLLFGPDPQHMDYIISDTDEPPTQIITAFPFKETWWTIKVRDQYGSTIYADPICIRPEHPAAPARTIKNLTTGATYDYIQAAIDDASGGDQIVVSPGINPYPENIDFKGKNVTLRSINPNDPNIVANTFIKGGDWKPVVTLANAEKRDCVVAGFTISGGSVGVHCSGYGTAPKVTNCLVTANKGRGIEVVERGGLIVENSIIAENQSDGVHCSYSRLEITNCTVTANQGIGIDCSYSGGRTITNCIIWDNSGAAIERTEDGITEVTYSDVDGGFAGEGNIGTDPCFADATNGDYQLKSQAGRWNPDTESWVIDAGTSACIDAGEPTSDWAAELWPHGKRINMGAYGGTCQASMSLSSAGNIADLNDDHFVNWQDLKLLAGRWLHDEVLLSEDLNRNGFVNFTDFAIFAKNWLLEE